MFYFFFNIFNIIHLSHLKQIELNTSKVKQGEETEVKLSRKNNNISINRAIYSFREKIKHKIETIKLFESKIESLNKIILRSEK